MSFSDASRLSWAPAISFFSQGHGPPPCEMKNAGRSDVSGLVFTGYPRRDLFAGPAVIVVQVDDQDCQSVTFLAAFSRTLSNGCFQTIEDGVEILGGTRCSGIARHAIHAVVCGAECARCMFAFEVIAVGLLRTTLCAGANIGCQLLFAMKIAIGHSDLLFFHLISC